MNLKEPFRARAAEDVARDSYLYWLNDTHWNAVGTGVAAMEVAEAITKGTSYAGGE